MKKHLVGVVICLSVVLGFAAAIPKPPSSDHTERRIKNSYKNNGPSPALLVPTASIDQCANGGVGDPPAPCSGASWVNGNVNQSKAHWLEGQSVPYRITLAGFTTGSTGNTVTIGWDTTKGGKHALDYITSFDRTETLAMGNNPCSGIAGCSLGTFTTAAIPVDPKVTAGHDQIPANGDDITQIPGVLTLFGGTITNVSAYSYSGSYAGDSHTSITVTFTSDSANMSLAWGGHIGSRDDWGPNNVAVFISGSPYHMSQDSCSFGCGVMDRAISSSAVGALFGVVYVDDDWSAFSFGTPIADADPVAAGNQPAVFGSDAWGTIDNGISRVASGGTVKINPHGSFAAPSGAYAENVAIAKGFTLDGNGGPTGDTRGAVVIDPAAGNGISVSDAAGVTIKDLRVTGAGDGIDAIGSDNLTVSNVQSDLNTGQGANICQGSRASILGGSFTTNTVGINVDGTTFDGVAGTALIQGVNLNSNLVAGLRIQNSALVDAGEGGYTGLGTSTGDNDFSGYVAGGALAIANLNQDAGPTGTFTVAPPDMKARNNIFALSSTAYIEQLVSHDVDFANRGFVDFGGAQGLNTAPVANDDPVSTDEDTQVSGNVLSNDTDADSDPLTASLLSGPSNAVAFALNANGSFSYTPSPNFFGSDSFTYKANDGFSDSNVATVSITVNSVNDPPSVSVVGGGSCSSSGNGGTMNLLVSDVETSAGSLTLIRSSSNNVLVPTANVAFGGSAANRTISITAVPQKSAGTSIVTITVNDADGGNSSVSITVIVGTSKKETLNGTNGADLILGGNGDDTINARAGNDLVCGGNGNGTVDGGDGDDTLDGGTGNDVLLGGAGRDILIGGLGADHLDGGADDDILTGGSGGDAFIGGLGFDVATDFNPAQGDTSTGIP